MKVKRYFSNSMQDALRQIREDLGPDAVILSNSKQNGGVEILATAEYDEQGSEQSVAEIAAAENVVSPSEIARQRARKSMLLQDELDRSKKKIHDVRNKTKTKVEPIQARSPQAGAYNPSAPEETAFLFDDDDWPNLREPEVAKEPATQSAETGAISTMQQELRELRAMIAQQGQLATAPSPVTNSDSKPAVGMSNIQEMLAERLESLGLCKAIKEQLVKSAAKEVDLETAWARARKQIHGAIRTGFSEIIDLGGVVSLVGPTGSGKTMTLGKLAAQYVMCHGESSVALVTTDRYRIAAHEQLKVFGRILNIPVHVVDDGNSLDDVLDACSDRKLVLVDTAGLMKSDRSWGQQLKELKVSRHKIQNYLVMPATGQYAVMKANYNNYKAVGLAGTIITKLDEAVSFGEAISYLISSKLPCAYFTDGQRVPEDIRLGDKKLLINKAEELLNSSERWVTIPSQENQRRDQDERASAAQRGAIA